MGCSVLGVVSCAVTWAMLGAHASAAENYMIHRTEVAYEFIDGDQVQVVASGVRQAFVIDVNVGRAVTDTGTKVVARLMHFRCAARTASIVSQRTFSSAGQALTEGRTTDYLPLRATDDRDQARFRFVCQDDRKFSNYHDANPVEAADKLFALLHPPS